MKYKSFKEFNSTTPCKCGGNCQCGTTTTTEVNESADQKKFKQFWDKSPETAIRKTFGKDYDKAIDNRVSLLLTIVNDPDDAEKYSEMDFLSLPSGISSQLMNMDPKDIDSILDESLVAEGKSYQEKFKDEASTYQEMINDPSKRVYDIVDFAQFTTGGMTEKQWEMFMYGRYAKHRDDTDTKTKEKMYKVLTKWLSESEVNEKDDAGTHLDNLADLVGNAKSFMEVGKELKAGKYKYDFSTGMMPMYMIHADGFKFAILNKKYVDDGDREVGDIAIGLMESLVNEKDDAGTHLKDLPKLLAALDKKKNGELYNEPKITDNGKRGHYLGLTTHAGPNHKNYFTDLIKKLGFKNVEFDGKETNGSTHLYGWIIKESKLTEKFNFSKKEVEAAANLIASAISQADKVKAKVHDLEYDKGRGAGFEISIDGEKYDGGSYVVKDNGDVVNAAIGMSHPNAVYNTIGNKDIADVFINMEKYESLVDESVDAKDIVKTIKAVSKMHDTKFMNPFLMHEEPTHIHKELGPVKIHPGVPAYDWRRKGVIAVATSLKGSKDWQFTGVDLKDLSELPKNFKLPKQWLSESVVTEMNGYQSKALVRAVVKEAKPGQKLSLQDKSRNINFLFTKMSDNTGWFCNTGPREHKNKKVDHETTAKLFGSEGMAMGIELDGKPLNKFNYKFKGKDANAKVDSLTLESAVIESKNSKEIKELEKLLKSIKSNTPADQGRKASIQDDIERLKNESVITEAKKYKFKDINKAWSHVYGEDMEDEYQGFYQEVTGKYKDKVTKADIAKIWSSVYGEDITDEYDGFYNDLQENLKQVAKLERLDNLNEQNADGTISDDEDDRLDDLLGDVEMQIDELIQHAQTQAYEIGGSFRGPGMTSKTKKIMLDKLKRMKN